MKALVKGLVAFSLPLLFLPATALSGGHATAAAAAVRVAPEAGLLPPRNPSKSLPPSPDYLTSSECIGSAHRNTSACDALVLSAIAHARKSLENLSGMSFSLSAYEHLTLPEQLFVTVNLERIGRGLSPATELVPTLDAVAQVGAATDTDPKLTVVGEHLPGGALVIGGTSNWAGGTYNPLGSDYAWMYDDGYPSRNLGCNSPKASACWGHRDNIIGGTSRYGDQAFCPGLQYQIVMGAGYVGNDKHFGDSEAELITAICGATPPKPVITWARLKSLLYPK